MKKEETNDVIHLLIPKLEKVGIKKENIKFDVSTHQTDRLRGDVWISTSNQENNSSFEKNIIALIEAKHRNCSIGDSDWMDALSQGKIKAQKQGLKFYGVTNCDNSTRFYNIFNDNEIYLDEKIITDVIPFEIISKINAQISKSNSHVLDKLKKKDKPIHELDFRNSLNNLSNIYRSAGLKKGNDRIDPTISFVILKYISEMEEENRTLPSEIKIWSDFKEKFTKKYEKTTFDLKSEISMIVDQIWGENSEYKNNIYKDFKDLIIFPKKLKNEHYIKIYQEFEIEKKYHFHGANFDLFGVIYEEFANSNKKREFGEFYTRRHITNMVTRLLLRNEKSPGQIRICDPACGTGGFLTEAYKTLVENYSINNKLTNESEKDLKKNIFWGYDNDEKSVARTKLNMFLVGDGHNNIFETEDSLNGWNENNNWVENTFDYIITNPPMGKYEGNADLSTYNFTNESRYELLFVEKVIKATKETGEIAIIVNDGMLEAPSRENFRKKLLEYCDIHAIISLTRFAFAPYTKEKTYILFIQKKITEDIGIIQKTPIWHYILDFDGYANSDKRYPTKYHNDIPELLSLFPEALTNSKYFEKDLFENTRKKFEREVNSYEKELGLYGMKYKYVDINNINEENFYNLISEYYLRPVKLNLLTKEEYINELKQIKELLLDISGKIRL